MLLCCDITDGTIRTNYFLSSQGAVYGCGVFWVFLQCDESFQGREDFFKSFFLYFSVFWVYYLVTGVSVTN